MTDREKIFGIIDKWANKAVITQINGASVYDQNNASELTKALLAANIGDVTEWKERAERMHKEALKQKQLVSDSKRREDALRNQLKCALDMAAGMEHAKRTLKILYMSGVIAEEALGEAVKQAKLEIEEENEDDR